MAITRFLQRSYFINYLKHSHGISNNYPIIISKCFETSTPIWIPNQCIGLYTETIL